MFREGLARSIERQEDLKVVGQFSSSAEALKELPASGAGIVLLDIDLGAEKALDFVLAAKQKGFEGRILIVTAGASDHEPVPLIQAGLPRILPKHHSTEELCDTIRHV